MWTDENRGRYDRSKLRYPSDLTDEEWALIGPSIPPAKRGGNKRTVDVRSVVNGVMYILSTGCQWAQLPKDLPPRSTVNDYFKRWEHDGRPVRAGAVAPGDGWCVPPPSTCAPARCGRSTRGTSAAMTASRLRRCLEPPASRESSWPPRGP